MTTDVSLERVRQVVAEEGRLAVDVDRLGDDDDLYLAGMTSHACVDVMLTIEEAFDMEFPQATLHKDTFRSIAAIHRAVSLLVASDEPLAS
ncbi:MAG: acyl carrier protein [Acidimicrobiales bacterium]